MRAVQRLLSFAGLVLALSAAPDARAADLHVPAQYPSIQAAIAAAAPGDRVLVQPGTWPEALDFLGKGIEVLGVGGAAVTTIDATGLGESVVRFKSGEPAGTTLRGFTLTGGAGHKGGLSPTRWGGGVYLQGTARPTIRECVITGNTALGDELSSGGGVGVGSVTVVPGAPAALIDCVITDNHAEGYGGGIAGGTAASLSVQGCTITSNSALHGGGITGAASYAGCTIAGNDADQGGGLYGFGGVATLADCTLEGNTAWIGGGAYVEVPNGHAKLAGCHLHHNNAFFAGGAFLTASTDFGFGPFATVTGCSFTANTSVADSDRTGLVVELQGLGPTAGTATVVNCSFDGEGITSSGALFVRNTILRNDGTPLDADGVLQVSWSDIEGGWPGTRNIDADPLWVDGPGGDYHLLPGSPCINTGDPASPPDPDGSSADMGALPYHPWTDLGGGVAGAAGLASLSGSGPLLEREPVAIALSGAPPNAPLTLVIGASALGAPLKGGTLWPETDLLLTGLATDAGGELLLGANWPTGLPSGFSVLVQAWWADAGGPFGYAGSNGLKGTVP
jgi:hypothetical protein